jgi:hypothetical protein
MADAAHIPDETSVNLVAPAQAGAYLAYCAQRTDVMGPSLRWGDGVY